MAKKEYNVVIAETSKELTARERIKLKDTTDCLSLDELTKDAQFDGKTVDIEVDFFATLEVHNEKSKGNKDYFQLVLVAKDGKKYLTGSPTFIDTFIDMADELRGVGEDVAISVYRRPSKNFKDKDFITCSVL